MDLCTWDWGTIATLVGAIIPSIVALCIFRQWRVQKACEVIAIEAKSTINDLFKLNNIFAKLIFLDIENNQDLENRIKEFSALSYNVKTKLTFIRKTVKDEDNVIKNSINEFIKSNDEVIELFKPHLSSRENNFLVFGLHMGTRENNKYFQDITSIVLEICKDIAMYKDVNFKEISKALNQVTNLSNEHT